MGISSLFGIFLYLKIGNLLYEDALNGILIFFILADGIMADIKLDAVCTECESNDIFFDKHRYEIYCNHCGLILVQLNNIPIHNLFDEYSFNDFKEMQEYQSVD